MPVKIILDTNIFLHFKRIDHIEWEMLVAGDSVELIIMPVVVRELERHKIEHANASIRKRASKSISWLSSIFDEQTPSRIRKGAEIIFESADPTLDFRKYGLNPSIQDDYFIAGAIEQFKKDRRPVLITTYDFGLKLKVSSCEGLQVFELPEKYMLPTGVNSDEKEKQALRKKVQDLQNNIPKLKLCFEGGETRKEYAVQPFEDTDFDVENAVREEKRRHPKMSCLTPTDTVGVLVGFHNILQEEQVDRYNNKLDEYYKSYREYCDDIMLSRSVRQFEVVFVLVNTGSKPATDVDVKFSFPNHVNMGLLDGKLPIKENPVAPEPPNFPVPQFVPRDLFSPYPILNHLLPDVASDMFRDPVQSGPTIERPHGRVSYWLKVLKHHHSFKFKPIVLFFKDRESIENFHCDFVITSNENPDPVRGKLHFVFSVP